MTMKQIALCTALIALAGVGVSAYSFVKAPDFQQDSSGNKSPNVGSVGGDVEINN